MTAKSESLGPRMGLGEAHIAGLAVFLAAVFFLVAFFAAFFFLVAAFLTAFFAAFFLATVISPYRANG